MKYPLLLRPALIILVLLASCGGPPPASDEVTIPGYGELREQITGRDVSPLEGRLIVLDPGHGGHFRGAVGPAGLTEAEVNLGVALHLRGLLEWAGSEVVMTRTADTDFLSEADSSLVGDLAFRVAISDSIQPDVFLSLHHNSVASLNRTVNETQTYYPLGDSGASLDLARAIHRHLVLNLEITPARILPGNFHVLRNATVPAALGEPAMISHPVIEGRLSLAASQRLEAEAYFLGLLDYFEQGNPVWGGAAVDTLPAPEPGQAATMTWVYQADNRNADSGSLPPLDPVSVRVTLEGELQPVRIGTDGRTVTWSARDTVHVRPSLLEIRARNTRGRSTPPRRTLIEAATARSLRVDVFRIGPTDAPLGLRWSSGDGLPAPTGILTVGNPGTTTLAIGGHSEGWAPLLTGPGGEPVVTFAPEDADHPSLAIDRRDHLLPPEHSWAFLDLPDNDRVTGLAGPRLGEFESIVVRGEAGPAAPGTVEFQGTPLIPWRSGQAVWLEMPGYGVLADPDPGTVSPEGPQLDLPESRWTPAMLYPGLFGRVVVLDPAGGDSDPEGTGPLGLRGADLNLEVVTLLADYLRGAGAEVHLTRREGSVPRPEDKVALANRVRADNFLTVGRADPGAPAVVRHHHGSRVGALWSDLAASAARPLFAPGDSLTVQPSYEYLLRHTACPAIEVRLPVPETSAAEMRMISPAWLRAEAQTLFLALVSTAAPDHRLAATLDPGIVLARLPGAPPPGRVDLIVLDGQFTWTPDPSGDHSGSATDSLLSWKEPGFAVRPGTHTLEIRAGDTWQLWQLAVLAGADPLFAHGRLIMSGP